MRRGASPSRRSARYPLTSRRVHELVEPDGWTYTMWLVDHAPRPRLNAEHSAYRWMTADEASTLPLHPDLPAAWHQAGRSPVRVITGQITVVAHGAR